MGTRRVVGVPDLYDVEPGRLAVPNDIVYARFSLGVLPAQMLAQTHPGAKGALLLHACVPTSEFGRPWPQGVPLQIHTMEAGETIEGAELFLYAGDRHLFADTGLPDYDESAASLLRQRVLGFLDKVG